MKLDPNLRLAVRSALGKKAEDVVLLDLGPAASFSDYFLLLSGNNQRQIVAIADAVLGALRAVGRRPDHVEGYPRQEWILLDYGHFIIHIFTPRTRAFYDLERLWGAAIRVEVAR